MNFQHGRWVWRDWIFLLMASLTKHPSESNKPRWCFTQPKLAFLSTLIFFTNTHFSLDVHKTATNAIQVRFMHFHLSIYIMINDHWNSACDTVFYWNCTHCKTPANLQYIAFELTLCFSHTNTHTKMTQMSDFIQWNLINCHGICGNPYTSHDIQTAIKSNYWSYTLWYQMHQFPTEPLWPQTYQKPYIHAAHARVWYKT